MGSGLEILLFKIRDAGQRSFTDPDPCFLNHEAHEEKAKNEHTKKDSELFNFQSCVHD